MPELLRRSWSDQEVRAIRAQVQRITSSGEFQHSLRRRKFLEYIVEETLAGRHDRLKGYTIAVDIFGRSPSFDAQLDPVVRIEAGRLRDKLSAYYATEGQGDTVVITLSKGTYVPSIKVGPSDRNVLRPEISASTDQLPRVSVTMADSPAWAGSSAKAALLGAALCLLLFFAGWWTWSRSLNGQVLPERPSLAVLPFENLGEDAKWTRFASGLTEDVIADLAHFRDLIVIARSSTQRFKIDHADAREVGRALNVKYVVEGSIQSVRDRIRVTANLIDTQTGNHVWSQRYDRPLDDLFSVQNELTQNIVAALGGYSGAVAEAERRKIRRKPPSSLTAYDTYLLGVEAKHKVTKESLSEAQTLLKKSLEIDPQLARAYVALVDTYWYQIDLGLTSSVKDTAAKMLVAGEKAVAIDPNDGKSHYALGLAAIYNGKLEIAATEFKRAEALAPSDADTLLTIAWSLPSLGETAHAVALAERALALNPYYPDWYNQGLSYIFLFGARYDQSVKYRLLVKEPFAIDYAYLAIAYAHIGQAAKAAAAADRAKRLAPDWIAEAYLSEAGGFPNPEAELFIDGAKRAGLPTCVSIRQAETAEFIPVASCVQARRRSQE